MWNVWMRENLTRGVALAVGTVVVGGFTALCIFRKFVRKPPRNYPRDTVILHSVGRAPWAPCISPFPVKVETYLRMAKIPHQLEHGSQASSKGKIPWMTYNDEDVADSQMCIEYLNDKLDIDLNKHLTTKDKAIARAFMKLAEEDLFWGAAMFRWVYDKDFVVVNSAYPGAPKFIWRRISKKFVNMLYAQGMGRHSQEEVIKIMEDDLLALSTFLGDKAFFMGSEPSEVDCCMFAMLTQIVRAPRHPANERLDKFIENNGQNLIGYCERMKARYWPDWGEICKANG